MAVSAREVTVRRKDGGVPETIVYRLVPSVMVQRVDPIDGRPMNEGIMQDMGRAWEYLGACGYEIVLDKALDTEGEKG